MKGTYLLLIGAWVMFALMVVVALEARRRSRRIDRLMREVSPPTPREE